MYKRPLRSDEIYHSWFKKGATKKDHKYIARINLGDKFRYFYDSAALKAFREGVNDVKDAVQNKIDYHVTGEGYKRDARNARRKSSKLYSDAYVNEISKRTEYESLPYTSKYRNASNFGKTKMEFDAVDKMSSGPHSSNMRKTAESYANDAKASDQKYYTHSLKGISESVAKKASKFLSKFFDDNKSTSWNDPRPKKFTEDIITEDIITEKKIPEKRITEKKIPEKRIEERYLSPEYLEELEYNSQQNIYPDGMIKNGKRKKKRK